jgi:squalene-hopene/tetraprenyl-beta-curcumene cyclase
MHKSFEFTPTIETGSPQISQSIAKSQEFLLARQTPEGYWIGDLEADASVSAGYITLMRYMTGRVDPSRRDKVINKVLEQQNQDGSWSAYFDGPGDLSVSIQTYLGLKLGGVRSQEPFMLRAREFIISQGGIQNANLITKVWLALFGQYDWLEVPSIPPEIIFLPNWFYFNIYEFASWSRATIMALTILLTNKPVCDVSQAANLDELYSARQDNQEKEPPDSGRLFSWKRFFRTADCMFKLYDRLPVHPGRKQAMRKVEQWIVEHQEADGSWGGIMLPWIYSMYALKSLGYTEEHPVIERALAGLEDFIVESEDTLLLQPAVSPVWDTAWTTIALSESGLPVNHPALQNAAGWLLSKEIRHKGDWGITNPHTRPGGWAFEFHNNWYPDLDDSAVVPQALLRIQLSQEKEQEKDEAIQRSLGWILDMQSKDGGWAAFDRDNDRTVLDEAPFSDFISPLDPTCSDVTAHVIELLNELDLKDAPLYRAVAYLRQLQEPDGAWYGRWGVNYLYGTALTIAGLASAGEDPQQAYIQKAVDWLISKQNEDGGWGESCQTYTDPSLRGMGASTASQTAWVVIGLIAVGQASQDAVKRGIDYLLSSQQADGSWNEPHFTGSGFPKVFYLRYDLYKIYFPLIALSRYRSTFEHQ